MKIIAISDTHGSNFINNIPSGDLLLIGGDISPVNLDHSFYSQQQWFNDTFSTQLKQLSAKFKHIVFIGGNHDTYLSECNISKNNDVIRNQLPSNVHYLCDNMVNIEGVKIYGTPWCNLPTWARKGPPVWNFALPDDKLENIYSKIPNDIDILLTHGPSYGFCDSILDKKIIDIRSQYNNLSNEKLGSKSLTNRITNSLNAKYVLSGHIHSAQRQFQKYIKNINNINDHIQFSCVSILNEEYKYSNENPPLEISI